MTSALRQSLDDAGRRAPPVVLGLAIGAVGGIVAHWLHVPLAFMLGALFATMAASVLGAPVAGSDALRSTFLIVIGLFLGEGFTADLAGRISAWPFSIALAILYAPVAGWIAYLFYRRYAAMSRADALFSAIPGGLSGVVLLSGAMGADERNVALSQSLRVAIVVVVAPALFFGLLAFEKPDVAAVAFAGLTGSEALILTLGAAVGILALRAVGAPIPFMMGPMLASAALRLAGVVEGHLPHWFVEAALVVVGSAIGCRFAGASLAEFRRLALWTLAGTAMMIVISGLFALLAWTALGVPPAPAMLAYAPGGVAEMAIIAIAIDADPGFVATHHLVRIAFILLAAPAFGAWITRRWAAQDIARRDPTASPERRTGLGQPARRRPPR